MARDEWFRVHICQAESAEAILRLIDRPEYRSLFSPEKWTQIASCVMQARPRSRLNPQQVRVSSANSQETNLTTAASASALNVYIGDVGSNW